MAKGPAKKVVFISSFPPRKCGIATFTSDLINSTLSAVKGEFEPQVVAMRSDNELKYAEPVKFEIRQDVKSDYICAADYINFSHVDLVCTQHEFGLFGGDAGDYLSLLLKRLRAPVITTLHTILDNPNDAYRDSLTEVCDASYKVITMNERGVSMLRDIYGVPGQKIELIAHGIPDLPFVDSSYYKHKFRLEGRKTILTFGLLNKNKGIEYMLEAMPAIIEADPSVVYIVLGMTHPLVLKQEGESYRFKLQHIVKDLGLQEHVIFHNRFVKDEELHNFLCAADIYATPYLSKGQLTSGTLSFAVGTGKAVVSTPYWAAEELLAEGRGKLVPFGDSQRMAEAIVEVLQNDSLFYSMRRRAYDYGRTRTWPKIGQIYWKLFNAKRVPVRISAGAAVPKTITTIEVPEPSLAHLKKLTDETGLLQHAKFTIPDRRHGYTTDDNARAVIAMTKYCAQYPEPKVLQLLDIYLSFVMHAQNDDGTFKNFMNYDRSWRDKEPETSCLGRALWAFGTVMAKPPTAAYISIIKDHFDRSVKNIQRQHPRGMAYSILGMVEYLRQFPGASDIKREMEISADGLVAQYEENSCPDWQWFEDTLTYENAVMPHALFVAGMAFGNKKYLEVAEKTCVFLLDNTFNTRHKHFSFIGCNGWYERGREKAQFDQQPIEATSTVMMLRAAYDATEDSRFLRLQRKAFDWFLGKNDLHIPLYDFRTKGCYDGLMSGGVNANQGAESTLCFLLSLLAIVESYTIVEKIEPSETISSQQTHQDKNPAEKQVPIKTISAEIKTQKDQVEESA